jgi:hypothetical protein
VDSPAVDATLKSMRRLLTASFLLASLALASSGWARPATPQASDELTPELGQVRALRPLAPITARVAALPSSPTSLDAPAQTEAALPVERWWAPPPRPTLGGQVSERGPPAPLH